MADEPFAISYGALPLEGDASHGALSWQTLISGDRTPSSAMVVGVAELPPGGHLKPHFHPQAEFYFGLAGSGRVWIAGEVLAIAPNVAVHIPGGREHAIRAGEEGLRLLYGFAEASFDLVAYTYTGTAPEF